MNLEEFYEKYPKYKAATATEFALRTLLDKFICDVFMNGLFDRISESTARGMNGTFGQTKLLTFVMAGRLMLTFCRGNFTDNNYEQITYVTEEKDPLAERIGINTGCSGISVCADMIWEVINNWPDDVNTQRQVFHDNKDVKLDVMAIEGW